MNEILISDTGQLIRTLNELPNNFVFRGQSDAVWTLEPSLERTLGPGFAAEKTRLFEDYSLQNFESKFHLYDNENIQPDTKLAWLAIMQHYGVPTRLLDFTQSPYVALYFAIEGYQPHAMGDFAIFALDYTGAMDKTIECIKAFDREFKHTRESLYGERDEVFSKTVDRYTLDILWVTEPKQVNKRLDRQAGSFLLSGNPGKPLNDVVNSATYENVEINKYIIEKGLYQQCYALLRKMNITSKSVYGDLNGLAQSIRMELQVRAVR